MLMQGTHDSVVIQLIKDEIEDLTVYQSVYGAAPLVVPSTPSATVGGGSERCVQCSKIVYLNERVAANGKVMHKTCFR